MKPKSMKRKQRYDKTPPLSELGENSFSVFSSKFMVLGHNFEKSLTKTKSGDIVLKPLYNPVKSHKYQEQ